MADRTPPVAEPEPPELEPIPNAGFRDLDPDGVLEQPFWERYNRHLEMPLGWALAVFFYVCLIGLFVLLATVLVSHRDTKPVPITTLGGDDEAGLGNVNGGGDQSPLAFGEQPKPSDLQRFQNLPLSEVREELQENFRVDVGGEIEIPESTAAAVASLDKTLRDKLFGARKGDGPGSGAQGTGADTTRARGLRWVILFDTRTGRDYLNQLAAMKAVLLVPATDGKRLFIFRDLINPKPGTAASDADLASLADKMQFSDIRKQSVDAVCEALGIRDFVPTSFFAYFPKELEQKLATLERQYRNKLPEQVRQTKFKVVYRGGEYDLIVIEQELK